jgi:ABC-type transport system involved in cytochrome c biogenesis permease component
VSVCVCVCVFSCVCVYSFVGVCIAALASAKRLSKILISVTTV